MAAVTAGKRLYFSGPDESSQVMLCTDAQTRKLQKVETSNTMLLVPPNDVGGAGQGQAVAVQPEVVRFAAAGSSKFLYESEVALPRIDQVRFCVYVCSCVGGVMLVLACLASTRCACACTFVKMCGQVSAFVCGCGCGCGCGGGCGCGWGVHSVWVVGRVVRVNARTHARTPVRTHE